MISKAHPHIKLAVCIYLGVIAIKSVGKLDNKTRTGDETEH